MNATLQRFEQKFAPEPNSGCWLWDTGSHPNGYGCFWFNGRQHGAHRMAWVLYRGDIPHGYEVCHQCDMPACVNPDHLFLGLHKANMDDRGQKGRHVRGEDSPHALLSQKDVQKIWKLRQDGLSMTEIGKRFGVTKWAIYNIFRGKNWSWL